MICPLNYRPFLQIGRYQVPQQDDRWLREILVDAGESAGMEIEPLVEDLLAGIGHYLEHGCSLRVLAVEALLDRISAMLRKVGLEAVAHELPVAAPPVTIALDELARDTGYELAFFTILRRDIDDLHDRGVRQLRFSGMRRATQALVGSAAWNRRCDALHAELAGFLRGLPACVEQA